jgi:hypothetical protein
MKSHYTTNLALACSSRGVFMSIALRILCKWPNRDPKVPELMETFDMSRASAYRWLAELKMIRPDTGRAMLKDGE